jgi:hypothetical protein
MLVHVVMFILFVRSIQVLLSIRFSFACPKEKLQKKKAARSKTCLPALAAPTALARQVRALRAQATAPMLRLRSA